MSTNRTPNHGVTDPVEAACDDAVRDLSVDKSEAVERRLKSLADAHPDHLAPRFYLAQLYQWVSTRQEHSLLDRRKLRLALEQARTALDLESPPRHETVRLVRGILHALADHQENAEFCLGVGHEHPDPLVRFHALCWASVALKCRAHEFLAEGKSTEADKANRRSVESHKDALTQSADQTIQQRLESYFGESHTVRAYVDSGLGTEWVEKVRALLCQADQGHLSPETHFEHLCHAADVACDVGLPQDAVGLAERALDDHLRPPVQGDHRIWLIHALGTILRACQLAGWEQRGERAAYQIEEELTRWETESGSVPRGKADRSLGGAYQVAGRYFLKAKDWDRAIKTLRRATELWHFGPSHFLLALVLWSGKKDRAGALAALRNAASDARMSGKGACRNLRVDFLTAPEFGDVRDEPDFLRAIEVSGVIE